VLTDQIGEAPLQLKTLICWHLDVNLKHYDNARGQGLESHRRILPEPGGDTVGVPRVDARGQVFRRGADPLPTFASAATGIDAAGTAEEKHRSSETGYRSITKKRTNDGKGCGTHRGESLDIGFPPSKVTRFTITASTTGQFKF
jgi:hypothetical protein